MTQTVTQDFLLILTVIGLGVGIGLLFDCYRLLRRKTRPGYYSTQLSDLLFWLICTGPVFYVFFCIIGGEVRFFTLLFLPIGMALYFKFASPYLREPLYYCFIQIGRGLRFLLRVLIFCMQALLYPFRLAVWGINIALQFLCGLFRLLLLPFRYTWRVVWRRFREWRRKK
ncbi:MAG TPA: hypothetical protein GXX59_02925 [Syntrophomonadaceae bacterium]|nr:hypothetical protein [Syntrophomonadaceae bacterium]